MKNANSNPMGIRAGRDGVDHGAVRLARKKANISNYTSTGENKAKPGVSLSRPTAKSSAVQPMGKGQPAAHPRATPLSRRKRTK